MADIYLDHDVSRLLAPRLAGYGHAVRTAPDISMEAAGDDEHLFTTAEHGWILVSHNAGDFEILHNAWRNWSRAWGVPALHAGIVIVDHGPSAERAPIISAFLASAVQMTNELYRWRRGSGWRRQA